MEFSIRGRTSLRLKNLMVIEEKKKEDEDETKPY